MQISTRYAIICFPAFEFQLGIVVSLTFTFSATGNNQTRELINAMSW